MPCQSILRKIICDANLDYTGQSDAIVCPSPATLTLESEKDEKPKSNMTSSPNPKHRVYNRSTRHMYQAFIGRIRIRLPHRTSLQHHTLISDATSRSASRGSATSFLLLARTTDGSHGIVVFTLKISILVLNTMHAVCVPSRARSIRAHAISCTIVGLTEANPQGMTCKRANSTFPLLFWRRAFTSHISVICRCCRCFAGHVLLMKCSRIFLLALLLG